MGNYIRHGSGEVRSRDDDSTESLMAESKDGLLLPLSAAPKGDLVNIDQERKALLRQGLLSGLGEGGEEEEERAYERSQQINVSTADDEEEAYSVTDYEYGEGRTPPFSWKKMWLFMGPGFLMSIAYLDPGNLESDLQAGATAGYSLLWLLLWATVMGLIIQLLAARLGVTTGSNLAEHCRHEYSPWSRYTLWIMAEIAIVGSDIQEVIGSAIAFRILSHGLLPLWAGVLITGFDGFIFLFLENFGVRKLEALFGTFIAVMGLSFALMFVEAKPDAKALVTGLIVPSVRAGSISKAVGIVGAVIMPHNVFLHSALVQSRSIDISKRSRVQEALRYFSIESCLALFVSFWINVFVMAVFAKGFYGTPAAENVGLANAGEYLQSQFGGGLFPILYIWAIGLLAAGQSSTMTGTYAGQFVMSGFLNFRVKKWLRAFITRSVAIVPTVMIALLFDQSDQELDQLNEWLNVLQSVQLPFAIVPLLCIVSSERIMGTFKIRGTVQVISWMIALLVVSINGYLLVDFFLGNIRGTIHAILGLTVFMTIYLAFLVYLVIQSITGNYHESRKARMVY